MAESASGCLRVLHTPCPLTLGCAESPWLGRMGGHPQHSLQVGCWVTPNIAAAERDPSPRPDCSHLLTRTGCLLLRAPAPHAGMVKAKKAQLERRRWLRGLEGDGPSVVSPLDASPSYLHVE